MAWSRHANALAVCLEDLAQIEPPPEDDFNGIRDWVDQLLETRLQAVSHLLALAPFMPFETDQGEQLLDLIAALFDACATAVEDDSALAVPRQKLRSAAAWWTTHEALPDGAEPLRVAFAMPQAPIDDMGEFRADWVLQHYAYKVHELLPKLMPHLAALGVPGVTDLLAAVSILGGILDCEDPIAAYVELDRFVGSYLAASPDAAEQVRAHLEAREAALRRTRQVVNRSVRSAQEANIDAEARAAALVDAYKRVLEGPFRQFSWALHCLRLGTWEAPPSLTNLRERLIAGGGALSSIARHVVLPDLRNSEAHETLEWDGLNEEFVTERGRVDPATVSLALFLADSFVHGCEAGLAAVRALDVQDDQCLLPTAGEAGRMPAWRRAQAFFGTNGLRLTQAQLNTRHASLTVHRLEHADINPCFQALTLIHRLLPDVETYSVATTTDEQPLIIVSAGSLQATMPVWECAVSRLDMMPFSTFLAANLDARLRVEGLPAAVRSIAWIAADDALDAIDGSPEAWSDDTRQVLDVRLQLVAMATTRADLMLDTPSPRLASVRDSASELGLWITQTEPAGPTAIERHPAIQRLRLQWRRWGPVARHPLIAETQPPETPERRPYLRRLPRSTAFRSL